jgi:hypothetical protein
MGRWTGAVVLAGLLCSCAADATENTDQGVAAPSAASTTSSEPADTSAATTVPDGSAAPTAAPVQTVPAATPPTGSSQNCGIGERLDDADGDTWGECVPDERPVDLFAAQVAAEAAGLPPGIPCNYPATILAGDSALITCAVVNSDASEGDWSFTLASDHSVGAAPSYLQTKAAPPTTPPPTQPTRPLVGGGTDPRFDTCKEAKSHGYGPYFAGDDVEYGWYRDADEDGIVCE